jgi:hypothetical protein
MRALVSCCCATIICGPALAASSVVDNERVEVWDYALSKGAVAPATPEDMDSVTMFLEGGTVRTQNRDGIVTTATRKFGDAVFNPKGSANVDTALSDDVREVVIGLKDAKGPPPNPPTAGVPISFPRLGAEKTLEGDRFLVWRFNWVKGVPVPMHHHDKDSVMVFRYNGTLQSTAPSGDARDIPFKQGQVNFSKAGITHTETLITDHQSAVDLELK